MQGVDLTNLTNLLALFPMINQTILMQQMQQSQQLYQIIYQFSNGSYEQAVPNLFQFLNITPYLSQFITAYNKSMDYNTLLASLGNAYGQFMVLSQVVQQYTNITSDQLVMSILLQNDNIAACLNATGQAAISGGSTTIPAACAIFTNQTAYAGLLSFIQTNNFGFNNVTQAVNQFLYDLNVYANSTGSVLASIDFQDLVIN